MKNKILGISGSPRKGSNSQKMLEETLYAIKEQGVETELMILSESGIEDCCGDDECWHRGTCETPDKTTDFFYKKLLSANGFVFATPNWFNNVSGWMKKFMDRTNPISKKAELKGKSVILIVAGAQSHSANDKCEAVLKDFCNIHQLKISGVITAVAEKQLEIELNKEIIEKCHVLGKKLAEEIKNKN